MQRILVTGSPDAIAPVVEELEGGDAELVVLDDVTRLTEDLRALEPASVSCYVQMPVSVSPTGETAVSRLHSFLEQGLLTRFVLVDAVLPALAADASVLLVGGHTPGDRHLPDDRHARLALLSVLAHAVHADRLPATTDVRVLDRVTSPHDIAATAIGNGPAEPAPERTPEQDRAYADWRTELVGLGLTEF
jgi:hypothetical protein